jgi:hypothetical protein
MTSSYITDVINAVQSQEGIVLDMSFVKLRARLLACVKHRFRYD